MLCGEAGVFAAILRSSKRRRRRLSLSGQLAIMTMSIQDVCGQLGVTKRSPRARGTHGSSEAGWQAWLGSGAVSKPAQQAEGPATTPFPGLGRRESRMFRARRRGQDWTAVAGSPATLCSCIRGLDRSSSRAVIRAGSGCEQLARCFASRSPARPPPAVH